MPVKISTKVNKNLRSIIEWGILIAIVLILYFTGWHTHVIGTLQRGILATGLITPDIPEMTANSETANLDFFFTNRSGTVQSLHDFKGDVIFMNIWATWCPPCIAELPSIYSLYKNFKDDENISFIMVSMDEDFEKAKEFMESRGYNLPIYHYQSKVPGTYQSSVIPTTYIISPESEIVLQKEGFAKYDTEEFRVFLKELAR